MPLPVYAFSDGELAANDKWGLWGEGGNMQALGYILYMALGLFQIAATIAGIEHWLGIHWFFTGIIALFVAWTPVIGTVLGMVGAHYAWGWSWLSAFLLFFGPLIVIAGITLAGGALEKVRAR